MSERSPAMPVTPSPARESATRATTDGPRQRWRAGPGLLLSLLLSVGGEGCAPRPPFAEPPLRTADLVELTALDYSIHLDIRYATTNNFVGRVFYREPRAFLQRPAAEALVRAHQALAREGFGLFVFDGYRPWSVTRAFWKAATPDQRRAGFVASPRAGSKHNRGCAVDLTLYHLDSGQPVVMPTDFDDFTPRAGAFAPQVTGAARRHRDLLRTAMENEGFKVNPDEWWHFNHVEWRHYPVLDLPFEALTTTDGPQR